MSRAKITSKGQVTIPIVVRKALGVEQGDMLAFEIQGDHVVLHRVPTAAEVAAKFDAEDPLRSLDGRTDDGAVAAYFEQDWDAGWGPALFTVGGKEPKP